METEWCKEAEEQFPAADLVHCNMGHATRDTQVVHTRGSRLAAVADVEVGTEGL